MRYRLISGSVCLLLLAIIVTQPLPAADNAKAEKKSLPKLMDFGAKKCIQCKKMAPILEELKKEYDGQFDVEFVDVSIKDNAPAAEKFKVETIPLQVFLNAEGKELWRHEGFISKDDILAKWKELKFDFVPPKKEKPDSKPENAEKPKKTADQE